MKILTLAVAALVGVWLSSLSLSPASAQYPPPTGSVVLAAGDASPTLGEAVSIAASVLDPDGAPVAGVSCSFSIASQPGTDAGLVSATAVSDTNGMATTELDVGSTAGPIVVEALCGELSGQISVVAGAAAEVPVEPAAAEVTASELPSAGFGPGEGAASTSLFWVAPALALIAGSAMLYVSLRLRRS
jgi:hypothetical protein